jgi:RHS repeat-associated protein
VAFGIVTTDRGDVRALTDELGVAFAFYSYDAYGNPRDAQTRATSLDATTSAEVAGANVLRYAGYAYDAHSGLYYCSARYYDPATASFITKDPAKADGEESAYQYCGGDPVGRVDPSGELLQKILTDVPGVEQTGPTCWAAALASIVDYYYPESRGHYQTVYRIVFPNGKLYAKAASYWQYKRVFSHYDLHHKKVNRPLTFSEIQREILCGRPIYAGVRRRGAGHAQVIVGYRDGGKKQQVYFLDPNDGGLHSRGYVEYVNKSGKHSSWQGRKYKWKDTIYGIYR